MASNFNEVNIFFPPFFTKSRIVIKINSFYWAAYLWFFFTIFQITGFMKMLRLFGPIFFPQSSITMCSINGHIA